jgi:hypothetical protein
MNNTNGNQIYAALNLFGVAIAFGMMALSVWLAPVDLSTKGYWGMGIFLLTLSLVNFVQYRTEDRVRQERLFKLENAKNEKIIQDFIAEA